MADLEDAVLECACAFLLSCYPVDERLGVDGFLRVRFTYCATHYAAYYRRKICPACGQITPRQDAADLMAALERLLLNIAFKPKHEPFLAQARAALPNRPVWRCLP